MYVTIGFNVPQLTNPNEPETVVFYNATRLTPQPVIDAKYAPSHILDSSLISNAGIVFLPSKKAEPSDEDTTLPPTSTSGDNSITTTPRQVSSVSYWDSRVDLGSYTIVPQYYEPMGAPRPSRTSTSYDLSSSIYCVVYSVNAVMLTAASLPVPTKNACTLTQN